jgi:hypothetical protein
MNRNLHIVPSTAPLPSGAAPGAGCTDQAIATLENLLKAARTCRTLGLTVTGAIYGMDAAQPAIKVAAHPKLSSMLDQGRAWDDGLGSTKYGLLYRKGSLLMEGVLVFWNDYQEKNHA